MVICLILAVLCSAISWLHDYRRSWATCLLRVGCRVRPDRHGGWNAGGHPHHQMVAARWRGCCARPPGTKKRDRAKIFSGRLAATISTTKLNKKGKELKLMLTKWHDMAQPRLTIVATQGEIRSYYKPCRCQRETHAAELRFIYLVLT